MLLWRAKLLNYLRMLLSVTLALLLSLLLFYLMDLLLNTAQVVQVDKPVLMQVDIRQVQLPPKSIQQETQKEPPAKLETLSAAPASANNLHVETAALITDVTLDASALVLPEFAMEQQNWTMPSQAGQGTAEQASYLAKSADKGQEIVPIATRRPNIPQRAYDNQINGWVDVAFTVTNDGHVKNITVLDASPRGIFEANAVAAIKGWIYTPFKGEPRRMMQRIDFDWTMYSYNLSY